MGVRRVERDRELGGIARGLGEEQTTLDGGQGGRCELVGVGAVVELAGPLHRTQADAQVRLPPLERVRKLERACS